MQLSYLLTVEASDNDEKHNARLQYFLSGHGAYDFILDRNNGKLFIL